MSRTAVTDPDQDAPHGTDPGELKRSQVESQGSQAAWPVARASLAAAADGALAALGVLALLSVVALAGWFSADAGLRWEPRAALRVAGDVWALGQGAHLVQPWGGISVVPLGVTLMSIVAARRAGRRVAARAEDKVTDADVAMAAALVLGGYLVVTLVVVVLAGAEESGPSLLRALLGATVVVMLGALPALLSGTGRGEAYAREARRLLPDWVPGALGRAVIVLGLHMALACLLLGSLLLLHADAGAEAVSSLQPSPLDAVVMCLSALLVLPVLVVWTASWLVGPGVVLGTGSVVTPSMVSLGPLPAVPFAAALPTEQPASWIVVFQVAPLLAGAAAVWLLRGTRPASWISAVVQAVAAGLLAGLGLAVLGVAASGSIGPGRLGEVGVPVLELAVAGSAAFAIGALLAAVALAVMDDRQGSRGGSELDQETIEIVVENHGGRAFTPEGWRRVIAPRDPSTGDMTTDPTPTRAQVWTRARARAQARVRAWATADSEQGD